MENYTIVMLFLADLDWTVVPFNIVKIFSALS